MARRNLGIIQLSLNDIVLDADFGTDTETDIGVFLSEEQKSIIRNVDNTKLYYLKIENLEDAGGTNVSICAFATVTNHHHLGVRAYDGPSDAILSVAIYYNSGTYYMKS